MKRRRPARAPAFNNLRADSLEHADHAVTVASRHYRRHPSPHAHRQIISAVQNALRLSGAVRSTHSGAYQSPQTHP